jgi:DNA-binding phage protein
VADNVETADLRLLVALRIGAEMRRRRMTCRHLAKRAGVDDRTVRNLLAGKNARLDTLERVSEALGLHLAALVTRTAA